MIIDEVGVKMWAVRTVFAVLALVISRASSRAEVFVGDDCATRAYLGKHRQHGPRDGSVEGLVRTMTQKRIPRIGASSHGGFEDYRGKKDSFKIRILCQDGHGHEHVRRDRQLHILECRSV